MKRFDRKFGPGFLRELPESPAVYLFKDEAGEVIYAGKAKNVRRRLSQYRSANRRKAQRKMRTLVREAQAIEVLIQPSEAEALLVENELIRKLRPRHNVDGAFDFLYPSIGAGLHEGRLVLCLTSDPDDYAALDLSWHGAFRPRWRARAAFDALVELFGRLGHIEPRSRRPPAPRKKGSHLTAIRRVPESFLILTRRFLDGEDDSLLASLSWNLLEKRDARDVAAQVEADLRSLQDFYGYDVRRLRDARLAMGRADPFVPAAERDGLFIRARLGSPDRSGGPGDSAGVVAAPRDASPRQ